jgi:hypothetical protein
MDARIALTQDLILDRGGLMQSGVGKRLSGKDSLKRKRLPAGNLRLSNGGRVFDRQWVSREGKGHRDSVSNVPEHHF